MFIRFDVIHERDGQTDRQTLHESKDRAYASHRAVKIGHFLTDMWRVNDFKLADASVAILRSRNLQFMSNDFFGMIFWFILQKNC